MCCGIKVLPHPNMSGSESEYSYISLKSPNASHPSFHFHPSFSTTPKLYPKPENSNRIKLSAPDERLGFQDGSPELEAPPFPLLLIFKLHVSEVVQESVRRKGECGNIDHWDRKLYTLAPLLEFGDRHIEHHTRSY